MNPTAKYLIISGLLLIAGGLLWQIGGRLLHLFRLPGDIYIEKGNVRFYFPIATCIVISIVISLIIRILNYFR